MPSNKQSLSVSLNMRELNLLERDSRYGLIKPFVENGKIQTLADIFTVQKRTVIANDLGKKVRRFNELMDRPEEFSLGELIRIQKLSDLTFDEMMGLVRNHLEYLKANPPKLAKKVPRTRKKNPKSKLPS
jgi:DNA-binding HxlR family transcriptional regulator